MRQLRSLPAGAQRACAGHPTQTSLARRAAVRRAGAVAVLALLAGCATTPSPDRCKIDVVGLDAWQTRPGRADAAFVVRGEAGSRAKTWLAARLADGRFISGDAREVGPGPFQEVVALKLTGRPAKYVAVLEVAGRRCTDDADAPGG